MDESPASSEAPLAPTASTVTDTEEGRAFFQRRLALLGLTMFALAGGSWVVLALVYVLEHAQGRSVGYHPLEQGGPFHLGVGLISGALWLVTSKGHRSGAVLHTLDIVVTTVLLAALTLGSARNADPVVGKFIALLCFYTGMLGRAIVVPSTARRTLLLGIVSGIPVVGIAVLHGSSRSEGAIGPAAGAACWTASGIVLATVASLTIFRLRREVQHARVLGQYTLEAKIGEGGMGEVWRASHVLLKRPTAVKLLPPGRTGEALAEAHDLGLVHRDIKPANVLLLPKHGEPELAKVVDFGLVKDLQQARETKAGLTAANTITGTPLYMAPEAIQNPEAIDCASDLYALGAVGWYLLVGRPVFDGGNIIEVCSKHLHQLPTRPSEALGWAIAADLEDVVLTCLEKKQEKRPRDARELRRRLQACSVANQWTEEQAAQWWRDHERTSAPGGRASGSRTIALDIATRAA